MKRFFIIIAACFCNVVLFGQKTDTKVMVPDPNKKIQVVEAACGECQFKLKGDDCDLAVRIDGKAYFVDGTTIDAHGDAAFADYAINIGASFKL